jgi:arylsulfatase A-like enzyme
MNRRIALLALLLSLGAGGAALCGAAVRPNVVLILVDDLGWTDLGCYGSTFHQTPRLDAFAAEGVRFTNAYAASPVCSPTRAAIMTGRHPARLKITDWIPGMMARNQEAAARQKLRGPQILNSLPHRETTLAEALREQGYQTFFAGKWHLGDRPHWPQHQGFEINRGGIEVGSPPGGYYSPYKNPQLSDGPEGEYLTDRLASEAVQFVAARDRSRPFFLCLWFYTVHQPIEGCREFDAHYQQRAAQLPHAGAASYRAEHRGKTRINQSDPKYAAMVRSMDQNVGRVLDALEQEHLEDETFVLFTSDNGGLSTTRGGGPTSVIPLRAGKGWCYEGGIRVPLVVRAPGVAGAGEVCDAPAIAMDFYPTILEYASLAALPQQHLDGVSLLPVLRSPREVVPRTLVWHFPHYHGSTWTPGSAIRQGDWKLVEFYEDEVVELYDLRDDVGERNDLSVARADVADPLRATMHAELERMGASYPQPNR